MTVKTIIACGKPHKTLQAILWCSECRVLSGRGKPLTEASMRRLMGLTRPLDGIRVRYAEGVKRNPGNRYRNLDRDKTKTRKLRPDNALFHVTWYDSGYNQHREKVHGYGEAAAMAMRLRATGNNNVVVE